MKSMNSGDILRGIVTVMLVIGAILITVLLFIPQTQELVKNPVTTGLFGTVIGFWFRELSQSTGWLFGSTKAAQEMSAQVTAFAVSPGTVSSDAATPNTPTNNSSDQGTAQ